MSSEQQNKSYERLFLLFSSKVEKVLIRLTLVCFALLVSVQALLQIPYIRKHVTRVEPLEGRPYTLSENTGNTRQ